MFMVTMESSDFYKIIKHRLQYLYGENAEKCMKRMQMLVGRYGVESNADEQSGKWTEKDAILITYGDTIKTPMEYPLQTLFEFANKYIEQSLSGIHILPFFPYSSDDGFSVIDYRVVREDLGSWYHINEISKKYKVMADLVINHVSRKSSWFRDYQKDVQPASEYFIEMDPETDLMAVTRPRNSPLLTEIRKGHDKKYVWCTFSDDQIDLDFSNPNVLFEFLDLILFYISKGVSVIRLDAVAYLWKKPGTNCIHLPETHEVIRLIRNMLDSLAPHVTLITETNVPHDENIKYFGKGDEAHMIYQFSLPPLLLYTLLFGDSTYLTEWAEDLDVLPEGNNYFNFTASHDGIGVRPIENLVPQKDFDTLIETVKKRGGKVSLKANPDGRESPYELNTSYFDAMKDDPASKKDLQVSRFLCSQTIMLSLQGVPGIYLHSLTATPNDLEGVEKKGYNRAINRKSWELNELRSLLDDKESTTHQVFYSYKQRLNIRREQPAFHPDGDQEILNLGKEYFALLRTDPEEKQKILSISNITDRQSELMIDSGKMPLKTGAGYKNLLGDDISKGEDNMRFQPYETKWLIIE